MELSTNPVDSVTAGVLLQSLPGPRRENYEKLAGIGGEVLAAKLYLWNTYLAAVVLRTTGVVEVELRNTIDNGFSSWNLQNGGTPDWITAPVGELATFVTPPGKRPLREFADIKTAGPQPSHHDYVAGLAFGSWTQLLPVPWARSESNPRNVLWEEALRPRLHHPDKTVFASRAHALRKIRNRATHHRPLIFDVKAVEQAHQDCVEVTKMMNPQLGEWLRRERWILEALKRSPLE